MTDLPFEKDVQSRATIRIERDGKKSLIEVVARGEAARELNRAAPGSRVEILGRLLSQSWRTAGGIAHFKLEVHADEVKRNGDV